MMKPYTRVHLLAGYFDSPWTVPEILKEFAGSVQQLRGQQVSGVARLLQITGHGKLRWRYVPVSALSDLEDLNEFSQEDYDKAEGAVRESLRKAIKAKEQAQAQAKDNRPKKRGPKAVLGGYR